MSLTPDDVQSVVFNRAPARRHGYDEGEVDDFLSRVVDALRGTATLTPADVRAVTFRKPPFGRRGYHMDEVDAFLDLIESELHRHNS